MKNLLFITLLILFLLHPAFAPQIKAWSIMTLDSKGYIAEYSSIAIDSKDDVHIIYFDESNEFPKYATDTSGMWQFEVVGQPGTGYGPSIAIDSSDNVHMMYDGYNIFYYVNNISGFWTQETLDSQGYLGAFALDSSAKAYITHYNIFSNRLFYSTNSSGEWIKERIDSGFVYGTRSSIATDSNNKVHISYHDTANKDLKYATNASGSWENKTLDRIGDVGDSNSIAVDSSDRVHISYYDETNGGLKYATNTSGQWLIETIDSAGDVGENTSLAIDSSGNVHISYYDGTERALKYTNNSTGNWTVETVDDRLYDHIGRYSSIAVDSLNNVHISYYSDEGSGEIKYATTATPSPVPPKEKPLVPDNSPFVVKSISPEFLTAVNGFLFFIAPDDTYGYELWRSDGTEKGTVMVKDIHPGPDSSLPSILTDVKGHLYFSADDGAHGRELWRSDGTEEGTVMVKDIIPGSEGSSPKSLTDVNGILLFSADDSNHGRELWRSDGTDAGTFMIKNIHTGLESSNPVYLTNVNAILYFSADDGNHGRELWRSDGTQAGTVLVEDINTGPHGAEPESLANIKGALYFTANDGVYGFELWKSHGTEVNTFMVRDINPGIEGSRPGTITDMNSSIYFWADDGSHGIELWRTDGTELGTNLVKDINPGSEHARTSTKTGYFTELQNKLYFSARNIYYGNELWVSDGTEAGTMIVKDIAPGQFQSSNPDYLAVKNNVLYFSAWNSEFGEELWQSDGTESGTVMVEDVKYGERNPAFLTVINEKLYFRGNKYGGPKLMAHAPIPVPSGKQYFVKPPSTEPWRTSKVTDIEPVGIDDYYYFDTREENLKVQIGFEKFMAPVDIYGAYTILSEPDLIYVLNPDGKTLSTFTTSEIVHALATGTPPEGLVPWKSNVTGPIDEVLIDVPVSSVLSGVYSIYIVVTPANDMGSYYLWETYFSTHGTAIWGIYLDDGQGSGAITLLTTPDDSVESKGYFTYSLPDKDVIGIFTGQVKIEELGYRDIYSYSGSGTVLNSLDPVSGDSSPFTVSAEWNKYSLSCGSDGTYTITLLGPELPQSISGDLEAGLYGCVVWF
jgi:ELWxxDGT repeat protein